MEIKFASISAIRSGLVVRAVEEWLEKHPHITIVSHSSFGRDGGIGGSHVVDIFYKEPEPESYRKQGQPG